MRYYHLKGTQFAIPSFLKIMCSPYRLEWQVDIDTRAWYDQPIDSEQHDWLKLTGVSYGINAQKDSCMCSWRANVERNIFEFGAYAHVDKDVFKTEALYSLQRTGGQFIMAMNIYYPTKQYQLEFPNVNSPLIPFGHNKTVCRIINPWAGGTLNMPKTISFGLTLLNVYN